jgi:hypothetical protein
MSEHTNKFRAGDFTSGKMGQIFKEVFMGRETTIINHKQFGECYVIPKTEMKKEVNFILGSLLNITVDHKDGLMVVTEGSEVGPLEQMVGTPYRDFILKSINDNDEGLQDEADYLSFLTKLVDCLYTYDMEGGQNEKAIT